VLAISSASVTVELGEGIHAQCRLPRNASNAPPAPNLSAPSPSGAPDLSQLSSMLKARWKGNTPASSAKPNPIAEGQIRSFKIVKLDAAAKTIEVELA
jgi:small subunit ribosomal protein S1